MSAESASPFESKKGDRDLGSALGPHIKDRTISLAVGFRFKVNISPYQD